MRREILIDSATGEIRIALLEDDLITELFVERPSGRAVVGNIYKGRVSSILPGMQSAFVTIGLERDAFLYVEDVLGEPWEDDVQAEPPSRATMRGDDGPERDPGDDATPGPGDGDRTEAARIEDLLREGQEITVQVTKDPVGQKGARITSQISLPGRFLVYLPGMPHVGVSRKIDDPAERERLRSAARAVLDEQGIAGGCIVRTVGAGRSAEEFRAEATALARTWGDIRGRGARRAAPALLHEEVGAVGRVLRDVLGDDVNRVLADAPGVMEDSLAFVDRFQPGLRSKIRLYDGAIPIFEALGVEQQIDRALRARVWLKSGGSIVINQTEALVAIDVNTGKYVGTTRLEETILTTNLEAVREIVRQIRLRDLGGIIVIDFIDMEEAASREQVIRSLEQEMRRDRSKSRMQPISAFGLVEITRQRTKRSLERILCRPCPSCGGSGRIKSPETVSFEILRALRRRRADSVGGGLLVRAHPEVAALFEERRTARPADEVGAQGRVMVRADPSLSPAEFHIEEF